MRFSKKLNQIGSLHMPTFLGIIVVLGIGAVGYRVLGASHAATLSTTVYGYKDYSSFQINNGGSTAPVIIDDTLSEASGSTATDQGGISSIGSIKAAVLNLGNTLVLGGRGGASDTKQPSWLSTTICYTMRTDSGVSANVSIASGQTSAIVTLKPAPTSPSTAYWSYKCVKNTKSNGINVAYNIKVASGGPVYVYRADILTELAY